MIDLINLNFIYTSETTISGSGQPLALPDRRFNMILMVAWWHFAKQNLWANQQLRIWATFLAIYTGGCNETKSVCFYHLIKINVITFLVTLSCAVFSKLYVYVLFYRQSLHWTPQKTENIQQKSCLSLSMYLVFILQYRWAVALIAILYGLDRL